MQGLRKTLSWQELLSIGLGAVVGWSWIIYAGLWSSQAGSIGGIIAFLLTGILCSLVGLAYAELTSAYPKVGGDVVFALEGLGEKGAIVVQWAVLSFWFGLVMIETMMIPVILTRLGIPIPQAVPLYEVAGGTVYLSYLLLSLAFNALFAFINLRGVGISGRFQTWAVYILLAAAVLFFFSGISLGDGANAQPFFTDQASFAAVMLMLPGFMAGFNAIPQAAEEGNVSANIIGKLVVGTVWASVIFYLLIVIGLAFAAPEAVRAGDGLVVVTAVELLFDGSAAARIFVCFASLLGMLTTWNASYIAASRLMVGLGRAKYLPPVFAEIDADSNTPKKAILILFIVSSLITLLGTNQPIYVGIVNIFSMGIVLAWLVVCMSFLRLQTLKPDLTRPYKVAYPKLIGWLSILFSIAFLYLYTPFGPAGLTKGEWIGVGAIVLIAVIFYFTWNVKGGCIPLEERRHLLGLDTIDVDA